MLRRAVLLSVLLTSVAVAWPDDPKPITLQKGDRIVFLGDSITQGGGGKDGYITRFKAAVDEKDKDLAIEVVNAGISGNKVPDLQRRLEKDVLAKKPTVVFVYIGINDVWHGETDPKRGTSPEDFEAGLKDVVGRIQAGGARVVLCTPTVIGEKPTGNKLDDKLEAYAAIGRKVAKGLGVPVCDLRQAFLAHLKEHNPDGKEKGVLTSDRVHLNAAGNKVVAEAMLKAVGR